MICSNSTGRSRRLIVLFLLFQISMEVQEFSLGTAPPMFGGQGTYWSMEGKQVCFLHNFFLHES